MSKSVISTALVILVVAGSVWYVTAPPKGPNAYRDRAALTAETLRSQVQSTRIWAETLTDGEGTEAAALVAFREAEQDATGANSDFESYEPPSGTNPLRSDLSSLASEVTGALAELRIAAEQERWEQIPELAEPLPELSGRLREFELQTKP